MASRHALLIGGLWVAAATAATSVGLVAVRLVADQVGGEVSAPLSSTSVRQALSSVTPTPEARKEPAEDPDDEESEGRVRTVTTDGGVVSGRCRSSTPTLLYATPADGYRTERTSTQTATLVRFVGSTRQVTLTLTCREDDLRVDTRTDRIGTRPAPTAAPRETHDAEPSEAPEPSETPEHSQTPEPRETDTERLRTEAPDDD